MGRLHLAVGTRYERDGQTFLVLQVLRDGRLVVEDQSGGGQGVVTRDEVTAAWERGALRFAVRGPGVRVGEKGEGTLPTAYTIADFHLLPEAERVEAWRRYTVIRPLLAWPAGARTRRAIARHLADRRREHGPDLGAGLGAVSRTSVGRCASHCVPRAPRCAAFCRTTGCTARAALRAQCRPFSNDAALMMLAVLNG